MTLRVSVIAHQVTHFHDNLKELDHWLFAIFRRYLTKNLKLTGIDSMLNVLLEIR